VSCTLTPSTLEGPSLARAAASTPTHCCSTHVACTDSLRPSANARASTHARTHARLVRRDRGVVEQWVRTAEAQGFKALCVTVDAQRLGRREADERNRFMLPAHLQVGVALSIFSSSHRPGGLCVHVCVCACVCMHVCDCLCVRVCARACVRMRMWLGCVGGGWGEDGNGDVSGDVSGGRYVSVHFAEVVQA